MHLTGKQVDQAKRRIRRLYQLNRAVTAEEVVAEVESLHIHNERGTMDDFQEQLYAALSTGPHPIF